MKSRKSCGGPTPSKWRAAASVTFGEFFGVRSGGAPSEPVRTDAAAVSLSATDGMHTSAPTEQGEPLEGEPLEELEELEVDVVAHSKSSET